MKSSHPSPDKLSAREWQTLGELKVRAGADPQPAIQAWLAEVLRPLRLHADLLKRIAGSAHEAAHRALEKGQPEARRHIHLLAFAPLSQGRNGQTWGFFRLEKLEDRSSDQSPPEHSIEFYLYVEGQADGGSP